VWSHNAFYPDNFFFSSILFLFLTCRYVGRALYHVKFTQFQASTPTTHALTLRRFMPE
jgi:hypothetical protein